MHHSKPFDYVGLCFAVCVGAMRRIRAVLCYLWLGFAHPRQCQAPVALNVCARRGTFDSVLNIELCAQARGLLYLGSTEQKRPGVLV